MRVIVTGRLKSRSYETREGEKRTSFEIEVDEIGPSLRYATAKVTRTTGGGDRSGGGNWGGNQGGSSNSSSFGGSGGGSSQGGNNRNAGADPWAQAQSDEPPF